MKHLEQLTAIVQREGDGFVGLCPEIDVASQVEPSKKPSAIWTKLFPCFSKRPTQARLHADAAQSFL